MTAVIIIAVIVILLAAVLSVSATFTITYTNKWQTKISILWIEKEIELTKILDFILFPKNKAEQVKAQKGKKKKPAAADKQKEQSLPAAEEKVHAADSAPAEAPAEAPENADTKKSGKGSAAQKEKKPNYLKNLWDTEGIVGILSLVSNMLETASGAVRTLMKGFHIYSFYVKIIVGGGDADEIARAYGRVCAFYYPFKGAVLGGMKVDNYDDLIMPDFIAPRNEYGLQFIGSVSVGLLLRVVLTAGKIFVVNLIKNK